MLYAFIDRDIITLRKGGNVFDSGGIEKKKLAGFENRDDERVENRSFLPLKGRVSLMTTQS